jgi:hypothetical protein
MIVLGAALVAGCGDDTVADMSRVDSAAPRDLSVADRSFTDAAVEDLPIAADLSGGDALTVADQAVADLAMPDLAVPRDLSALPDLSTAPDLSMPDQAMPDLAMPTDLTILPDLVVRADLAMAPATLMIDKTVVPTGAILTLSGASFAALETVNLTIGGQAVTSTTTDGTGAFVGAARAVPANATLGATKVMAIGAISARTASANVTVIPQCGTASSKCIFVTSTTYSGNLGGLGGADAKCAARATAVGLSGTFQAWLSSAATTEASRITTMSTMAYTRLDGTEVAANYAALIGAATTPLTASISITENGTASATAVWTDTSADGTSAGANDCSTWSDSTNGSSGATGVATGTNATWTANSAGITCDMVAALYCIEQ